MMQFATEYQDFKIVVTLSRQLPWSHIHRLPMKVKSKMDTKVRKPNRTPQIANKRTTFGWFSLFIYKSKYGVVLPIFNQKCGVVLPIFNQKCGVVLPIFNQNAELYFRFSIKIWSSTSDFQSIFGAKAQKNP